MLPIAQYLNNARGQAVDVAKNFTSSFTGANNELELINQAIMQKGINGLTPEERRIYERWYLNPVMGVTSAPGNVQLARQLNKLPLSPEDRNIMGRFVENIEQGGRKAMGELGFNAQKIVEGLGGEPAAGNKAVADLFNRAVMIMDRLKGVR